MAETQTQPGIDPNTGAPLPTAGAPVTPPPINTYDPNNPNPYTPPAPAQLPEITAPPVADWKSENKQPPVFGGGKKGAIGTIATLGDSMLRGYMKGREQAQQKQFAQASQMIKGLQYSHNNDGQKLASLAQQGYSPQNDAEKAVLIPEQARDDQQRQAIQQIPPDRLKQLNEYAAAKSAVDVSFGRMMKMYANATGLGQQKGKGKSKDKSQSDDQGQPNIGAMIASKNPQEKAQGTVLLTAKAGSPWVYYADQIAAQRQAQANDPARQHAQVMAGLQQKFDTLSAIPSDKRTPEQGAELAQVQEQMHQQKEFTAPLPKPTADKKIHQYVGQDGKEHYVMQKPDGSTYESLSESTVRETGVAAKPKVGWSKDAHGKYFSANIDPKTNQFVPGTENYAQEPPAFLRESIRTGEFSWKDETGNLHRTATTSTTSHVAPGSGGGGGHPSPTATATLPHGEESRADSLKRNQAWAKPGPYVTKLSPQDEQEFQAWAKQHPDLVRGETGPDADYDVRGRWLAEKQGDPQAKLVRSAFDGKLHASDKWKTPYHRTFSAESVYATPDAPKWQGDKLVDRTGKLITDETPHAKPAAHAGAAAPPQGKPSTTPTAPTGPRGDRVIGATGPTGQTKSRADAADSVLRILPRAKELIADPEVREELGSLPGRVSEVEMKIGNASSKTRELYGTLKSIYSLAGAMHGWRSIKVAEEFEKAYGGLHTDPDGLIGGMDAMERTAKDVYETGYKHPYGQESGAGGGHVIAIGGKHYRYNGSGDTADLKNYTEVAAGAGGK
jgi:hypothetical protein